MEYPFLVAYYFRREQTQVVWPGKVESVLSKRWHVKTTCKVGKISDKVKFSWT